MNEQPQQHDLQQDEHREGDQSLYRPDSSAGSSFSGYDLAGGAAPTAQPTEQGLAPDTSQLEIPHVHLSWEASEYIHHTKSPLWFVGYAVIMLVLLAVAFFLTHAWTFVILVVVMAIAMGVFATRPPRTLHYTLTETEVQIEKSVYHYSDFRSFGIVNDGALYSIVLIPTKRFMPAVNIYFAEEDGEKIVDILGARLPLEDHHLDLVDYLMRRLRF